MLEKEEIIKEVMSSDLSEDFKEIVNLVENPFLRYKTTEVKFIKTKDRICFAGAVSLE